MSASRHASEILQAYHWPLPAIKRPHELIVVREIRDHSAADFNITAVGTRPGIVLPPPQQTKANVILVIRIDPGVRHYQM